MFFLQVDSVTNAAKSVVNTPESFFTVASFSTLAGATGIVYIVCGAIQRAFNYSPKWLALAVSMLVSLIAAFLTKSMTVKGSEALPLNDGVRFLIAFLNGFLIYMSATGTNQLLAPNAAQVNSQEPPHQAVAVNKTVNKKQARRFGTNWWK